MSFLRMQESVIKLESISFLKMFNKSIFFLYLYFLILLIINGFSYRGVVDAMVNILFFYGIIFFIYFLLSVWIFFSVFLKKIFFAKEVYSQLLAIAFKMLIAGLPFFLFDDILASLLAYINEIVN